MSELRVLLRGEFVWRTAGRVALLRVLQVLPAREVAARLRVAPSAVSRWASGRRLPRLREREMIERLFRIQQRSWAMR
jgi:transcriptional regulator with XRE-family HTH domain